MLCSEFEEGWNVLVLGLHVAGRFRRLGLSRTWTRILGVRLFQMGDNLFYGPHRVLVCTRDLIYRLLLHGWVPYSNFVGLTALLKSVLTVFTLTNPDLYINVSPVFVRNYSLSTRIFALFLIRQVNSGWDCRGSVLCLTASSLCVNCKLADLYSNPFPRDTQPLSSVIKSALLRHLEPS